jgi:hypothetical protein
LASSKFTIELMRPCPFKNQTSNPHNIQFKEHF